MPQRLARRGFPLRANQPHGRLGLRQVNAPVFKGAPRKLPWLRRPRAQGERRLQHVPADHLAAVTLDFRNVLARVGARRAHQHGHRFIQRPARMAQAAIVQAMAFPARAPAQRGKDAFGLRAAQAQNGDASDAGRRGNGGDGVLRAHQTLKRNSVMSPSFMT